MDPLVSPSPEKLRGSRKDIKHLIKIADAFAVREETAAVLTLAVH